MRLSLTLFPNQTYTTGQKFYNTYSFTKGRFTCGVFSARIFGALLSLGAFKLFTLNMF